MLPPFQLTLFGQTRLRGPKGVVDLNSRKLSGLLAYLACGGPHGHARERLMALLWGTHGDVQARQNLRQALHRLRSVLGRSAILSNGDQISLAAEALVCDVVEFERLLKAGSLDALRAAVALYSGPLLADMAIMEPAWDEWVTAERQRLEHQALKAMIDVAAAELEMENPQKAIEAAGCALAINPLREDAHRLVLHALAAAGRKAEALAHYTQLETTLKSELGVAPDAATQALATELRTAESALSPARADMPVTPPQGGAAGQTSAGAPMAAVMRSPPPSAGWPMAHTLRRSFVGAALVAGVCILLAIAGMVATRQSPVALAPTWPSDLSHRRNEFTIPIAVLPLRLLVPENASAASFAAYLEEELTNYLSRFALLSVPPQQLLHEIGKPDRPLSYWSSAGLRYAIGGSIWADHDNLRLSVHMIDLSTQLQVWSRHFEHPLAEWPAQREFALRKIAIAAAHEAMKSEGAKPYANADKPTVPELLARGWKGLLASAHTPEFAQASSHFSEVLERDDASTSAMLGLAMHKLVSVMNMLGEWGPQMRGAEALLREVQARGVENHHLHYHLGLLYNLKNDVATALEEFERAIALNPSAGQAYAHKGRALIKLGRYAEALESIRHAHQLTEGRLAAGWALWRAIALLELGQDQSAGEAIRYAIEMQPKNPFFIAGMAAFSALSGDLEAMHRYTVSWREYTRGRTDEWRLRHMNPGPDKKPLPNRYGKGLRLALESVPEEEKAERAP